MATKTMEFVQGFSKKSKTEKINWVVDQYFDGNQKVFREFSEYWHPDPEKQKLYDEFSENTLTNYYMPFGIAPNFLINDEVFTLPLVIEESSVVAAASKAAKFWSERGGFHTAVVSMKKIGQVHFLYTGKPECLSDFFNQIKAKLFSGTEDITANMRKRGGGILDIELIDKTDAIENYYQLKATFDTKDSMGANFINSCLEKFADILKLEASQFPKFKDLGPAPIEIIMSILSNYTPECKIKANVECNIADLDNAVQGLSGREFAEKMVMGVKIAEADTFRATTHNKGIFNGIDAVILATGNDFRAVEACGHTYAARSGQYRSLSHAEIKDNTFSLTLEIPMALGTVGGLTTLHPLVKRAMQMLGNPDANELMQIAAVAGLANNFSAVKSLVTDGIQKGHMKMHLLNILKSMDATELEVEAAKKFFVKNVVSFQAVRDFLNNQRNKD